MRVEYKDEELRLLAIDATCMAKGLSRDVIKAYRKVIQLIGAATDERDLYALRGLRLKQLQGNRAGTHSMRLNDQYRLIVTFRSDAERVAVVIELVDYH
ncbi:type II toxin-antitoxin system RelE/ParE family toxin [Sinomonas sp. RB5]